MVAQTTDHPLTRYWPLILWFITVVFGFGGLYAKVDALTTQVSKIEVSQRDYVTHTAFELLKENNAIVQQEHDRRITALEHRR